MRDLPSCKWQSNSPLDTTTLFSLCLICRLSPADWTWADSFCAFGYAGCIWYRSSLISAEISVNDLFSRLWSLLSFSTRGRCLRSDGSGGWFRFLSFSISRRFPSLRFIWGYNVRTRSPVLNWSPLNYCILAAQLVATVLNSVPRQLNTISISSFPLIPGEILIIGNLCATVIEYDLQRLLHIMPLIPTEISIILYVFYPTWIAIAVGLQFTSLIYNINPSVAPARHTPKTDRDTA